MHHPVRNDLDELETPDEEEHFIDQDDDEPMNVPHSPANEVPVEVVDSTEGSPHWSIYDMYDTDYTDLEQPESPDREAGDEGEVGVRDLVEQFEASSAGPVAPDAGHLADGIDAIRPNQYPHRGLYTDIDDGPCKLPVYDINFSLDKAAEAADLPDICDSSAAVDSCGCTPG